jgi:hypothetical protein
MIMFRWPSRGDWKKTGALFCVVRVTSFLSSVRMDVTGEWAGYVYCTAVPYMLAISFLIHVFYSFAFPASRTIYPILGKCSCTPESKPKMTSCLVVPTSLPY